MSTEDLRIGEVAQLAGVSARMIRHYHHIGVLPEPARAANGYRRYGLRDVVLLLRVRQLVEVGLSLSEVRDVLTESGGCDTREILSRLDSDLAAQQDRIAARRAQVAALLARVESPGGVDKDTLLGELARVTSGDRGLVDRERHVADLLEATVDPRLLPRVWDTYREVLDDQAATCAAAQISAAFDALAGLDPHDPAVEQVAARAGELGDVVQGLLPSEVSEGSGDPAAAERVLSVLQAGLDPAQARCLALAFAAWREQSS